MANIIKRVWNQNRMVQIEDLKGMTFQAEQAGHTFQISGIDDEGNTVALTGTPAGVLLRPDNTDVALTCSVSGGVVSATLPANCYDVPGRFGLTIFITSGSSKTAIYAAVGTVTRTSSGTAAPGTTQSVVDLINAINAAINSIPASYSALLADIAPTYSNSALYSVGQYAWYDGDLKRCIVPITTAESYTAAHWTSAVLGQDVSDLKSAFNVNANVFQITGNETAGYGLAYSTGEPSTQATLTVSDYLKVVPGTIIQINQSLGSSTYANVFYDKDKNIKKKYYANNANMVMEVPDGCYYVRFSILTSIIGSFEAIINKSTYSNIWDGIDFVNDYFVFIKQQNQSSTEYNLTIPANTQGTYYVRNQSDTDGWFTLALKDSSNNSIWSPASFLVSAKSIVTGTFSITKESAKLVVTNSNSKQSEIVFYADKTLIKNLASFVSSTNENLSDLNDFSDMIGTTLFQYVDHSQLTENAYWASASSMAQNVPGYSAIRINNIPSGTYHINALSAPFSYFVNRSSGTATKASDMGMSDIGSETEITISYNFDLCLTIAAQFNSTVMMANGKLPDSYVYGTYGVNPTADFRNRVLQNVPKTFYCGSTREYTTLKSVIEEATKYMDSIVYVDAETFDLVTEFGTTYLDNYNREFACGLFLKNRVHLIFAEGSKVVFNYQGSNALIHKWFAPFNSAEYGFTLENCRIISQNCRYSVHDERASASDPYHNIYKRCSMEHTSDGTDWTTNIAIGGGLGRHGDVLIEDGYFNGHGTYDISYHNSTVQGVQTKSKVIVRNAYLNGTTLCANYGSSTEKSEMIVNGCSLGGNPQLEKVITEQRADNMVLTYWGNTIRS